MNTQRSESFLQASLDYMPVVFFVKDLHDRYLTINSEFEKLFNWKREKVVGKTGDDLFSPEVNAQFRLHDMEVIEKKEPKSWIEQVNDFNGRTRVYESHKFPYLDQDGNVYAVGGIALEITDKMKAEEELEASRKMLLRSARMAAVGEMAGGIAHEINNPLAVIHAHHFLVRTLAERNEVGGPEWQKSAKSIEDAIVRIQRIVKGLLAFARQSSHDPMIRTSVSELLAELFELCKGRMHRRNISLNFPEVDAKLMMVCRPYQVSQILINLLNNAFDAVSNLSDRWVHLKVSDLGEQIQFHVVDSGAGIPAGVKEKLFESFFTTKEFGFGTGLGLSIAKGLAMEHGGRLEFDEAPKNTTFTLTLPKRLQI